MKSFDHMIPCGHMNFVKLNYMYIPFHPSDVCGFLFVGSGFDDG